MSEISTQKSHKHRVGRYLRAAFLSGREAPYGENPHPTGTTHWAIWEHGAQEALAILEDQPPTLPFGLTWPEEEPPRDRRCHDRSRDR